jgi:hypothetical protein
MALSQDEYPIAFLERDTGYMRTKIIGRVYYYQGNFYHPLNLQNDEYGKLYRLIRGFIKQHKQLVENDRKDKDYRTLIQLANLESM